MASPICEVKDGGGAFAVPTDGADVTPANTVTIRLADTAGVDVWSLECVETDEMSSVAAVNAGMTIDVPTKTATFAAPAAGRAYLFESVIEGGIKNGLEEPTYRYRFGVYTRVGTLRVFATNETVEGDAAFGWTTKLNELMRSGGGGGGESNTSSNVGGGAQLAKAKVGVDLPFRSILGGANITATQNTNDVTLAVSGTIPAANQAAQTMVGDVTGTTAASVVSKVRGAAVGTAAGALTTGHTLRVTGTSTADWGAVDLANANATTGTLAVAKQAAPTGTGVAKVSGGAWVSAASAIVNADVDASAAIDWSKFGSGIQTVHPTGFNFDGLPRGRVYQRSFYDTLAPMAGSPYTRVRNYTFTPPDNATTKITLSATTRNATEADTARNSNAVREAVVKRSGGTVTVVRDADLIDVTNLNLDVDVLGTTVTMSVTDAVGGSPSSDTVVHTRVELDCVGTADLPASITITSATP